MYVHKMYFTIYNYRTFLNMLHLSTSCPYCVSRSNYCSYLIQPQPPSLLNTEARFQYLFARLSGATACYLSDSCLCPDSLAWLSLSPAC